MFSLIHSRSEQILAPNMLIWEFPFVLLQHTYNVTLLKLCQKGKTAATAAERQKGKSNSTVVLAKYRRAYQLCVASKFP